MYCANQKRFYLGKKKKKKKKKKEKKGKDKKSKKRQKVGHGRAKGNFVQHTPFLYYFLPILERLNCGGPREKMAEPHHLSLPLPLSFKHPFHLFSPLFFTLIFPSSLKSTHPNIV